MKKITLKLDEKLVENVETYAKREGTTLSKLVENYLQLLIKERKGMTEVDNISPRVKALTGSINLPPDFNVREEYTNYLIEKYK